MLLCVYTLINQFLIIDDSMPSKDKNVFISLRWAMKDRVVRAFVRFHAAFLQKGNMILKGEYHKRCKFNLQRTNNEY